MLGTNTHSTIVNVHPSIMVCSRLKKTKKQILWIITYDHLNRAHSRLAYFIMPAYIPLFIISRVWYIYHNSLSVVFVPDEVLNIYHTDRLARNRIFMNLVFVFRLYRVFVIKLCEWNINWVYWDLHDTVYCYLSFRVITTLVADQLGPVLLNV